jgi:hypothetical protein
VQLSNAPGGGRLLFWLGMLATVAASAYYLTN